MKNNVFDESRASIGTSVSFEAVCETADAMIELYALAGKRLIFVPKSPSITTGLLPDKPGLFCDKTLLDADQAYKVAGVGVVAGEKAFGLLSDGNTVLSWE